MREQPFAPVGGRRLILQLGQEHAQVCRLDGLKRGWRVTEEREKMLDVRHLHGLRALGLRRDFLNLILLRHINE
ncbi:hypothetical protein D3C81_2085960 [compost metagenome]